MDRDLPHATAWKANNPLGEMDFGSISALEGVSLSTHHHYHHVGMRVYACVLVCVHVHICECMFKSRNVYSCLSEHLCESVCMSVCTICV